MRFQPSKNPPEEKERTCDYCGKLLVGRQTRYCCVQHKKNHLENEKREKARSPKPCKVCKKVFKPTHQKQVCCSVACKNARIDAQNRMSERRKNLAIVASREKMEVIAEEKKQDAEEKPKKKTLHHPAIKRIIDMIKSKRQSCARFEESVGSVDYVGLMQIKYLEDKLKVMGVKNEV